ncbi:hypothetical protein [Alicyclobacillus sp. SO9]|uniref:hypothetical protein n=1 Tax=Alicyclobacillus sp. SO9 TaxID=2665646 RepID=UPI0018E8F2B9|nr:hypothetical protein [Alicyclobacillus sp. SO9]QQE80154.1 hypothetical protein GI364_06900 [Alicyclobacillus sp. SO9]
MFGMGKSKRMQQQLQELTEKLTVLTKHVEELNKSDAHRGRVNIEKLEIDQAFLDQLVFRLESLDIEELSGSLNLGNNFSPKVENGPDKLGHSEQNLSADRAPAQGSSAHESAYHFENDREASAAAEPDGGAETTVSLPDGTTLKATDKGYLMTL